MGRETHETEFPCGCVEVYSYDECCGMGSDTYYWKRCDVHAPQVKALQRAICDAEREINELDRSIIESLRKKAQKEPTTEERVRVSND